MLLLTLPVTITFAPANMSISALLPLRIQTLSPKMSDVSIPYSYAQARLSSSVRAIDSVGFNQDYV
jgi:hypothetical protein